jgi:hypothetical protein
MTVTQSRDIHPRLVSADRVESAIQDEASVTLGAEVSEDAVTMGGFFSGDRP